MDVSWLGTGWRRYGERGRWPQASWKIYAEGSGSVTSCEGMTFLGRTNMAGLAMMMFIALFAFGGQYFGWSDSGGRVQLALFSAYIFGIICGYRVKG
jgi:hypothetical protein